MRKLIVVGGLVAGLALAGCNSSNDTSTTSTTAAATSSTKPAGPTKAEVISKGDAICKEAAAENKAIPEPKSADPATLEAYFKEVVRVQRDQLAKLRALGTPSEDAATFDKALNSYTDAVDDFEKAIPDLAKDPTALRDPNNPIKVKVDESNKAAQAFGFKECGKDTSSSSSGGSSTTAKTTTG